MTPSFYLSLIPVPLAASKAMTCRKMPQTPSAPRFGRGAFGVWRLNLPQVAGFGGPAVKPDQPKRFRNRPVRLRVGCSTFEASVGEMTGTSRFMAEAP